MKNNLNVIKVSDFKFSLPKELIAQHPLDFRDDSRLLVLHKKDGSIEHRMFKDIIEYFDADDCFVFNDTKVIPAKLYGVKEKSDARIGVFLLRELNQNNKLWDVLVWPARKIRISNKICFGLDNSLMAEVVENTINGGRAIRFLYDGSHEEFKQYLYALGTPPLPDYIEREVVPEDFERYQTIYASHEGAVVAPSAGFHFSKNLLKRMELKDIRMGFLTLHNGLGAFEPQDIEDPSKHKRHNERLIVPLSCCEITRKSKDAGKRIVAVGTSVFRGLETVVSTDGYIKEFDGWTNKYIYPPYQPQFTDALLTGFHLSGSLLLLMTAGMAGFDETMNAYEVAIKEKYRFGCYGDAMLIID